MKEEDIAIGNLYIKTSNPLPEELITVLASTDHIRIERIVSHGNSTPAGFWYDQAEREFVLLVQGAARIEFEGMKEQKKLLRGDYFVIDRHIRHRVAWTTSEEETIWLAVFY